MEISNSKIYGAGTALRTLQKLSLPVRLSLALIKLSQDLKDSVDRIDKVRNDLIEKYGEKQENGKPVSLQMDSPRWKDFMVEFNELMDETSEVDFTKVILPMQVNGEDLTVQMETVQLLEDFVEFKEVV